MVQTRDAATVSCRVERARAACGPVVREASSSSSAVEVRTESALILSARR